MHSPGTFQENFLALWNIWVGNAAVYRAYGRALFLVEEADALGALLWSNVINVFLDRGVGRPVEFPRRASLVNGCVWALGFARAAVDTLFSNQRRHIPTVLRTSRGLVPARQESPSCLDLNGKNIGRLRPEQASASAYPGIALTMRLASSVKTTLAGCDGSLITSGIPSSPARRSSV